MRPVAGWLERPRRWLPVAIAAAALLLPALHLYFYQRSFGFHPLIVLFGEAAFLSAVELLCLVALGLACILPSGKRRVALLIAAIGSGLIFFATEALLIGSSLSNEAWGDTLNYTVTLSVAEHASTALDFLPLEPEQRKMLGIALLLGIVLLLAIVLFGSVKLFSALLAHLQDRQTSPRGLALRLAGLLGTVTLATAAICIAIAAFAPRALYGEPISAFFGLVPASDLLTMDNARVKAAIEDNAARAAFRAPQDFARKNVILIFADSLRADRMGVYGYKRDTTPFLSRLYAEKHLHRVDMALSTCSESFCGIASTFASRPFHQISAYNLKLHSLLRSLGYRTNFFLSGDHRGWRYLFDFYGADIDAIYDRRTITMKNSADDEALLRALDGIKPAGGKPNFFYFFLMSSHVSGDKLPAFERYRPADVRLSELRKLWNSLAGAPDAASKLDRTALEAVSNRYDNGVLQVDAFIERIFATLAAKGYLENSIAIILGDHGDGLGEHGHIGHTRYLFQEDIHIPLLIYDQHPEVYRNGAFATQIDIAPTIVDRLGLPIPSSWQGKSLLLAPAPRHTLHQTRRGQSPCFAIIDRSDMELRKYISCGDAANRSYEALFDLEADPDERNNLLPAAPIPMIKAYRREIDSRFSVIVNRCRSMECVD